MSGFPWEVTQVTALDGARLDLEFADGRRGVFDMAPYIGHGVFARLRNPAFFKLACVQAGTVTWPGELDIAPERLYSDCVQLSSGTAGADGASGTNSARPVARTSGTGAGVGE